MLRCLPACKHLADQGHEVFFDCFDQYHGVFDLVSYVKAGSKGDVLDLEIWPNKYNDFIKSKKTWHDFVYSHPEIKEADKTNIVLDKLDDKPAEGLPETYNLVAPFGISQTFYRNPLTLIQDAVKELGKESVSSQYPTLANFGHPVLNVHLHGLIGMICVYKNCV